MRLLPGSYRKPTANPKTAERHRSASQHLTGPAGTLRFDFLS
jgi:hypothetical protein